MAEQRHYADRIQVSFLAKETAYNVPIAVWNATTAMTLTDLEDQAAHEIWQDELVGRDTVRLHHTFPDAQHIAKQSVRIPYATPRAILGILPGSLGVTLGSLVTEQQGFTPIYRHKITPGPLDAIPSITTVVQHQDGDIWRYPGCKGESWTLRGNGAFLALECPLLGSGAREQVSVAFQPASSERWLLWGNCNLYLRDVATLPQGIPANPVQDETNLGLGALTFSRQVVNLQVSCRNTMGTDNYRVQTGTVRANLRPYRRQITVTLTIEINLSDALTSDEAALLAWYLTQAPFALEWQCLQGGVIVALTDSLVGPDPAPRGWAMLVGIDTWYVFPDVDGTLQIMPSAPSGTFASVGSSFTLRGENGYKYTFAVVDVGPSGSPLGEYTITQTGDPRDTTVLEYVQMDDEDGTTWYYWVSGAVGSEELSRALTPPTLGTAQQYGFDLLIPKLKWSPPVRSQRGNFDVLEFEGIALDDGTLPTLVLWCWNNQSYYLV